jgi:GntR family histidine utilization transcriptional repressor
MSEAPSPDTGGDPPLHQRILSEITERIVSGAWPPGHRIPFEMELAQSYGCSRMTVNKALSQLAKSGLIERRRKSGSFVRVPQSQAAVLEIHDIRAEVEALGLPYAYALMARRQRRATAQDRARLGIAGPASVLAITALHRAGGRPFCHEDRLIALSTVPDAESEAFSDRAPGPWLIEKVPWSAAEHRISAAGADNDVASALAMVEKSPCLVVERRTWSAERPVTHVRFTYPAGMHTLVARFTPDQR